MPLDLRLKLRARHLLFHALRAGFRLLPLPVATRDHWRQRFLNRHAGLVPKGPRGQVTSMPDTLRRPTRNADERAIGYVPYRREPLPDPLPATVIAFYLPQFHAIEQNDAWWGEGFTEWRNVTRALPQFEGHAQPRLPGALGFYDLSQPDAMRRQMQLARDYGIGAFCSYFYWFAGKTLLERPLQNWLADPSLDLPLCLCWANENWSRRWDGRANDILIAQRHSANDDLAFIAHIAPYLRDPRYLRVQGNPLLLVYRPGLLPDAKAAANRWRQWCRDHGIGELHLAYVQSFDTVDPRSIGFDAAVSFPPNHTNPTPITASQRLLNPEFHGCVIDWRTVAAESMAQPDPPYQRYPCVNPAWDNEPRRSGNGRVLLHASPRGYGDWLRHAIDTARRRSPDAPLVFINAWNEWAEGAVLEPDARLGHAYLEQGRRALATVPSRQRQPCAVVHVWYVELLDEIAQMLHASRQPWRIILTTAHERLALVQERAAALGLQAEIVAFENRGRDILPFLHVADRLLDEGVDTVLKLHTKRSVHRADGDAWRREMLSALAAPDVCTETLQAFADRPRLGMVAPRGHVLVLNDYIGANTANIRFLARRLGLLALDPARERFLAGSMAWFRLDALRPLLDAHLEPSLFETEAAQVDGTMAHAVERVLLLTVEAAGFQCNETGQPEASAPAPYPYARRSH